jgi:1,4-dihydroxy-2-naphthoate octaprenyltransferase
MKSFLKLVEIQTKVASILPFVFGVLYAQWMFQAFNGLRTLLFLASLICIDMATTALNNYMDYKRDKLKAGYNFEEHNAIVRDQIPIARVRWILGSLISAGAIFGLLLVGLTDYWILLIGFVSFGIGILYSYGPLPISHTPLGEIFSGLMMGFLIFFVAVYIQLDAPQWMQVMYHSGVLDATFNIGTIFELFVWSLPFVLGIAGIMLANNIADYDDDGINLRRTLPQVIGVQNSLYILFGIYILSAIQLVSLLLFFQLPIYGALLLLVFYPIFQKLRSFSQNPNKAKTFGFVVQCYILLGVGHILLLGMSLLFKL